MIEEVAAGLFILLAVEWRLAKVRRLRDWFPKLKRRVRRAN